MPRNYQKLYNAILKLQQNGNYPKSLTLNKGIQITNTEKFLASHLAIISNPKKGKNTEAAYQRLTDFYSIIVLKQTRLNRVCNE